MDAGVVSARQAWFVTALAMFAVIVGQALAR
jgi:hypothetical protein